MEEILVNGFDISTACRLCLSKGDATLNIFDFSTRLLDQVADVIMKCAPVQITRCDEMPNFICQSCNTQLENSHQFQMQVVQADQTLRRYLQRLRTTNKQIKVECSDQGASEDSLNHNTATDITLKCESLEFQDVSDFNVDLKEEVPSNCTSSHTSHDEIYLKSEIKNEPIDDNSSIPTKCNDDLVDTLSEVNDDVEIKLKNTEIQETPSPDLTKHFDNREDGHKNTSGSHKKHKKLNKMRYKCDVCNKHFAFLSKLNIHKRGHTGEKPYQCDVCKKCFGDSGILLKHQRVHTGEKPFQCDICDKCFSFSHDLKTHQRVHTGEKPYQCDVCNKSFTQSGTLRTHQRIHTGEKSYKCGVCDICNKRFSDSRNLAKHRRIHTGEKPYQCDVCNRRFCSSQNLIRHQRVHTGEKPYQCDVCNKSFSQSSTWKAHRRVHTSEKPYQCDVCNKCFRESCNLITHQLKHTGERSYQCGVCDKYFSETGALIRHQREHTG